MGEGSTSIELQGGDNNRGRGQHQLTLGKGTNNFDNRTTFLVPPYIPTYVPVVVQMWPDVE